MKSDQELLQAFAAKHDQASFAEIVRRYIGFVYAVAVRRMSDGHAAQDATQAVFIALARKAGTVAGAPSVIGWLHRSTCYETNNLMRAQTNRRIRETEAQRLGTATPEARPYLEQLDAMLDDALYELSDSDREAILARFFADHSYAEIGATLRLNENAARMRVERALGRLRDQLARRGVTSTAAALATALPTYASTAVPSSLAAAVTQASVASLTGLTSAATIFTYMSTTKIAAGVAVGLLAGGLVHQYSQSVALEKQLAAAQAETSATQEQVARVQRELTRLQEQARDFERVAAAAGGDRTNKTGTPATPAQPPPPGVTPKAPKGWFKNGSATELYEVGVDENTLWGGMPSAYAQSIGEANGKFGGMMQTISADAFLNQRVKLTAWMKTEDAANGAHLWLRVDGSEGGKMLQFDNMHGRAPKGTTDWDEYSIVLDVPPESARLNYGFFVAGKGKMWVNGLTITPVGADVPSTNMKRAQELPKTPVNLGFAPPSSG